MTESNQTQMTEEESQQEESVPNLDKSKFSQWLESLEPDQVIGRSCDPTDCPLTTYLNFRTDHFWIVNPTYFSRYDNSQMTDMPRWATKFVDNIDNTHTRSVDITVAEALQTLSKISF
jgi:hypothetical protein